MKNKVRPNGRGKKILSVSSNSSNDGTPPKKASSGNTIQESDPKACDVSLDLKNKHDTIVTTRAFMQSGSLKSIGAENHENEQLNG
mmetsp:Transcript_9394/g.8172  ORF Transcript_9394/g.8172 Transcript_9394/m.8172 type:complete len:86 (+) Transcript_9394:1504-1761(+)